MSASTPNAFLNIDDAHLRVTSGNVYAQGLNISGISFSGVSGLQTVTNTGNVTTNTLEFKNGERAFVATSNVDVKGSLDVANVATIYNGSNADYDQKQKFTSTVSASGNYFSNTLAVSTNGLYAIVGAHGEDKAYTFTRSGSTWTQENIFSSTAGSAFGYAVDISSDGTYAIVGGNGSASVFYRSSGSTWDSGTTLTAGGISVTTGYGASVSISDDGSYAIVGATGQNAAYIFRRTGTTTWDAGVKIALTGFTLGFSVAISGDGLYALLGAHAQHTAYVFKRTGAYIWSQQVKITESDSFGYSVALSTDGSRALIGATGGNGKAYSYERSGSDWSQNAIITASDAASGDAFGSAVSLSSDGSYALVGAPGNEKVYTFKNAGTVWSELGIETASDATAGHVFGRSVSISGDGIYALVGASGNEAAYSYERKETLVLDVRGEANVRTLNVSDDLTSNNLTVTGNLHVTTIRSDSNVVAEYTGPHDRPLRKYPEVALTADAETGSGYKGYKVTTNGNYSGRSGWEAFDSNPLGSAWATEDGTYLHTGNGDDADTAGQTAATFTAGGVDYTGHWIKLELPKAIKLQRAFINAYNSETVGSDDRRPKKGVFLGSNNDSTWDLVHAFDGDLGWSYTSNNQDGAIINFSNVSTKYKYILLLVEEKQLPSSSSATRIEIFNIEYYGYEEGSGSLDTTLKTVYNVPATMGTQLEVYYDGRETSSYSGSGTTVTDISPNTNNGTLGTGVGFDATYKAFTFNGATTASISGTHGLGSGSIGAHSFSYWLKRTSQVDAYEYHAMIGTGGNTGGQTAIGVNQDKILIAHNGGTVTSEKNVITDNTWIHVAVNYNGGTTNLPENHNLYINGIEQSLIGSGSGGNFSLVGNELTLGRFADGGNGITGSIANFRLYSKALNAEQVQELYDYQKDYFLGSKSQLTLYKGHLGVGVTEPSGQLELAGDERIQEYPPRAMTANETLVEGHGAFVTHGGHSNSAYAPWRAFNKELGSAGNFWIDIGPGYSHTAPYEALSTHSRTTLHDGSDLLGGWIDLVCPYPIKLSSVSIAPRTNYWQISLQRGVILGSNNGEDWYQIDTIDYNSPSGSTGTTAISNHLTNFGLTSTSYYSHIRLVCTHLTSQYGSSPNYDMHWQMGALVYFGTPGPTTLDKGSLSLGRSLDVPRVSRYDVDTETPRPEKLDVEFDTTVNSSPTDISGKGNHGTFNGASYVAADKAFLFDGSTDRIDATHTLGTGNLVFSESVWVNFDSPLAGSSGSSGKFVGLGSINGSTYNGHMLSVDGNGKVFVDNYSSFCNTPDGTIKANRWYHIVYARTAGSANSPTNNHIYVNGVKIDMSGTQSANQGDLNIQDGAGGSTDAYKANYLHVGGNVNGYFKGKISNYKLYSVCLEPSEVRKLYNLGRTGRSMVISDTAVGIGKAPEAQLDVRGNLRVGGTIQVPLIISHRWINADTSVTSTHYIPYNSVLYENPPGIHSGTIFTCPVKGIYECHFASMTDNDATYTGSHEWYVNGTYTSPRRRGYAFNALGSVHKMASSHYYIECNSGDTIGVVSAGTQTWYGSSTYSHSHMSIRLITPT